MGKNEKRGNFCIMCGEPIPEGIWVCPNCEASIRGDDNE